MNDDRAKLEALPAFDDPHVQIVYRILCDTDLVPPPDEHWEGFTARHVVAALASAQAASAELEEQVANLAAALRKEVEAPAFDPQGLTPAPNIARRLIALADELDAELDSGATWSKAQHTCNSVSVALREVANAAQAASAEPVADAGLREAVRQALSGWYELASALPQDDRIESFEWGAMHALRNALTTPAPAVAPAAVTEADEAGGMVCRPNGLMFDAFGEPRTRYVRVTLDGSHCVMHPSEGDTYLKDARESGDESPYVVADVWLSEREFDDLGEFNGF